MNTENNYNELLDYLSKNMVSLPDKPEENPKSTLEALWYHSCGCKRSPQGNLPVLLPELTEESFYKLNELIQKRVSGIPLAHLTGRQKFMGIDFLIDHNALIPRKETEILGYAVLSKIKEFAFNQPMVKVIDVCTGMGNLALAFAEHETKTNVLATDISEEAIQLAHKNRVLLALEDKVSLFTGDMLAPFQNDGLSNSIDIITCNPPYISNGKLEKMPEEIIRYEPKLAFNGGPFGLNIIFRLLKESVPFIKNKGWLCFELGLGQGEGIIKIMQRNKHFGKIETGHDEIGNIRTILAQVNK